MRALKRTWNYFIREPFRWISRCFFQPARFRKDFASIAFKERMAIMPRLFLPLLFYTWLPALLVRISIFLCSSYVYRGYIVQVAGKPELDILHFVCDALWATAASCFIGGFLGSIFGTEYGIVFGLVAGSVDGTIINLRSDTLIVILFGLSTGLLLGLTFNSTGAVKRGGVKTTTMGIIYGIAAGSGSGLLAGIFCSFWAGSALRLLGDGVGFLDVYSDGGVMGNIVGIIAGAAIGCLIAKIIGAIAKGSCRRHEDVVDIATQVGIAVAGSIGAVVGLATGDYGMLGDKSFIDALVLGGLYGIGACATFLLCYIVSYYRLPLYPISAFSMRRAYIGSCKRPEYVFHYLRHSSLHWDECVFLALPYLKRLLLIAAEQNRDEALNELHFILQERPQQSRAAASVALEIALTDLNWRTSLRDISGAQPQLAIMVTQEIRQAHPQVGSLFQRLEDASQDATDYYTQISWPGRTAALENMLTNLEKVSSSATNFHGVHLSFRLEKVVQQWRVAARYELERLSHRHTVEGTGRIENPYVPGLILDQRDPLFVGRGELAEQLSQALRSDYPPTFFLTGERRMGKSSILKRMPVMLGSHYLPVFYDLQSTGITSSVAALLAAIAEEVYDTLLTRGMLIRKLEYEQLKDDLRENEAVAYHRFSQWLKDVDHLLDKEDRILLLLFDEFEKLSEAEQNGYLDLNLLFGWFRSVIEKRSHVALLFSGVKSIGEMGAHWARYFVNVEILQVSFLHPEEARQLINHPLPDFPGERIFGKEVAEEILRLTGCHPFLMQALCSTLITHLNSCARQQANIDDIAIATEEVFKKWGDSYFGDLWERTNQEQRMCLKATCTTGPCTFEQIQAACELDELTLNTHVRALLRRALLCSDNGVYRIAIPIFSQWIIAHA